MKLIKYSLIAAVGVFLLPAPPAENFAVMQGGTRINLQTGEVLSAAASTFSDVSGFCQRQPAVCSTAGQALSALEVRAKYNFQRLYEWSQSSSQAPAMNQPPAMNKAPAVSISVSPQAKAPRGPFDQIITASIEPDAAKTALPLLLAEALTNPSGNTLKLEDLLPQWRGPARTSTG